MAVRKPPWNSGWAVMAEKTPAKLTIVIRMYSSAAAPIDGVPLMFARIGRLSEVNARSDLAC